MSNISDLRDYVQHDYINSVYKKNNRYDVFSDNGFVDCLTKNLWYMFNGESFQLPYGNSSVTPSCLINKSFDLMYEWRLSMLLNIKPNNFHVKPKKADAVSALNSISSYDIDNSFVLFYDVSSRSHLSFIMKFLSSFRNALAHGGFNTINVLGVTSRVYLAAVNYSKALTEIQLALRLFGTESKLNEDIVYTLNIIESKNFENVEEMFESNLELCNYQVNSVDSIEECIDNCFHKYKVYHAVKNSFEKDIYYIYASSADDIRKVVANIVYSLITYFGNLILNKVIFYLANCQPKLSTRLIEKECISKLLGKNTEKEIDDYIEDNHFSLNVLYRNECFEL